MAFYDNTGHEPIPVQQQNWQTHPVHVAPTSSAPIWLPQALLQSFTKVMKTCMYSSLLRDWAKTVPTIMHSPPQVCPVLRIIYELQGISQAEKPS